jgi:hypothetical protein
MAIKETVNEEIDELSSFSSESINSPELEEIKRHFSTSSRLLDDKRKEIE